MEVERKIEKIKVYFECPQCNKGDLRLCGASPVANPPEYKHRCTNKDCNYEQIFVRTIYPYVKEIEI
jgi:transcription elongation factor Elf1